MLFKTIGAVAALAAGLALAQAANAQTSLTMANWLPPSHLLVSEVMKPYAEAVSEATDGRVTITILDAPLGPPPAHYDFAVNGIADITFGVQGYTPGRFRTTNLAEMPFLADSAEASSVAYWRVFDKMLKGAGEYDDVKVLAVFTHGPGELFAKGRDVSSIEALSGAKLRVGGGIASDVATALGTVPVSGPSSKAYEILSSGVADGILFPFESVEAFRLTGLVDKGLVVPGGLYNTSFFVVMNKAKWDALSEEDKAAIDRISGEDLARRAGKAWDAADAKAREAMQGKVELTTADDTEIAAIKQRLDPVVDAKLAEVAAAGVDAKAALEMLKAEIEKVAAGK